MAECIMAIQYYLSYTAFQNLTVRKNRFNKIAAILSEQKFFTFHSPK